MKADSVIDSTVLRTDQSSWCLLATEIDFNRVPKWDLIKSEDGLLIAISSKQILQTDFLVYLCGLQDVYCGRSRVASLRLSWICVLYHCSFSHLSWGETLIFLSFLLAQRDKLFDSGGWETLMLSLMQPIISLKSYQACKRRIQRNGSLWCC